MTTEQFYNHFLNELKNVYAESEAANIADWVFENVTQLKKWERRGSLEKLSDEHITQLEQYLNELLRHKPVQYVLNEAWFYKMKFFVNEHVLIPRPETEELVSLILVDLRRIKINEPSPGLKMLDIGTGSGCIAISVKKNLDSCNVTALDVSENALIVAKRNADNLETGIDFVKNSFLNESTWQRLDEYDVIVSNPPYIPAQERNLLSKNVIEFEPAIALFVPDHDPFIFYKAIGKFALSHLKLPGKIYVEVHENYAEKVNAIFIGYNFKSEIKKDIYGKERIVTAVK